MINLETIKISRFDLAYYQKSNPISVLSELNDIKNGKYSKEVNKAREYYKKGSQKDYDLIKKKLPSVSFSGHFSEERKQIFLQEYTHLLVLDIDKLPFESIISTKEILSKDDYTVAIWISPSGVGLKILVYLDSVEELHKVAFDYLVKYLAEKYNTKVDLTGSDITRLCFSSYDPDLIMNPNFKSLKIEDSSIDLSTSVLKTKTQNPEKDLKEISALTFKKAYYDTENRNKSIDRNTIDKTIKYLKKKKLSITSSYESWYRVGYAISNTFTFDLGLKYYLALCELDGDKHDEEKSINMLKYCYRNRIINKISVNTILYLAKQQGMLFNLYNTSKK